MSLRLKNFIFALIATAVAGSFYANGASADGENRCSVDGSIRGYTVYINGRDVKYFVFKSSAERYAARQALDGKCAYTILKTVLISNQRDIFIPISISSKAQRVCKVIPGIFHHVTVNDIDVEVFYFGHQNRDAIEYANRLASDGKCTFSGSVETIVGQAPLQNEAAQVTPANFLGLEFPKRKTKDKEKSGGHFTDSDPELKALSEI